mgnify:CR=1 FL=1
MKKMSLDLLKISNNLKVNKLPYYLFLFSSFFYLTCQMSTETFKEGQALYQRHCETCHGSMAEGFVKLYPSLKDKIVSEELRLKYVCLIRNGTDTLHQPLPEIRMPAFGQLSDIEICNIINYLSSRYWNLPPVRLDAVETYLRFCNTR